MKVLNLDKLSLEENRILNQIAVEIRHNFNRLVESVGLEVEDNINWVVSSIASRNKYLSSLFLRCCYLAMIKQITDQKNDLEQIKTSDRPLARVLRTYFRSKKLNVAVTCTETIFSLAKRIIKPFYHFGFALIFFFLRFLGRSKAGKCLFASSKSITLLDTFVIKSKTGEKGSIYNGEYNDRYYPGLLDHLPENIKENIFYYPSFIGFRNPIEGFRLARKARNQFVIPDDFLTLRDYLYILFYPVRLFRIKLKKSHFEGFNVTGILKQERLMNCCHFSSLLGLLNYRFAHRTAQQKIFFKQLVDWYENQVNDRGMIFGFHRFHPRTQVMGYQGYIISKNLHHYIYPTLSEFRSRAVPDRIGVVGRGLIKDIQEFCDKFNVFVAPAFRFSKVWENRKIHPDPNVYTILVALPIGLEGALNILRLLVSVSRNLKIANIRFWVKPHPTMLPEQITYFFDKRILNKFHMKTGDFNDHIEGANLLIGNASSTCLEALAKGVPVIIIGDRNGVIENPIPKKIPDIMWKLCYSEDELIAGIHFFQCQSEINSNQYEEISRKIREDYFEPVTEEGIRRFLEIESFFMQS